MNKNRITTSVRDITVAIIIITATLWLHLPVIPATIVAACFIVMSVPKSAAIGIISALIACTMCEGYPEMAESVGVVVIGMSGAVLLKKKIPNRIVLAVLSVMSVALLAGVNVWASSITGETFAYTVFGDSVEMVREYGIDSPNAFAMAALTFMGIIEAGFELLCMRSLSVGMYGLRCKRNANSNFISGLPIKIMAPMFLWCLSENFTIALAVGAAAIVGVNVCGLANAELISYVIATAVLTPICIQGYCCFSFIRKVGLKNGKGIIMLLVMIVTFPISFITLGLIDQFTRWRAKRIKVHHVMRELKNNLTDKDGEKKIKDENIHDDSENDSNQEKN